MTNVEIQNRCERAEGLANGVVADEFRIPAFNAILGYLLAGVSSTSSSTVDKLNTSTTRAVKTWGVGLKGRLVELKEQGFFASPQETGQIVTELKTQGWNHNGSEVSARLIELAKSRILRRSPLPGKKRGYSYSNW